jgi:hypothetical protein
MIFHWSEWGTFPWNLGTLVGAVLAFFIARMTAAKSLRVWNKRSFIHLGVTAFVLALIFTAFQFDVLGYEKRLPKPGDIDSFNATFSINGLEGYFDGNKTNGFEFSEPENIAAMLSLHEKIAAQGGYMYAPGDWAAYVKVTYNKKGGGALSRNWLIRRNTLIVQPELLAILESDEFKAQNRVRLWADAMPQVDDVTVTYQYGNYSNNVNLQPREYNEFIDALDADNAERKIEFIPDVYEEDPASAYLYPEAAPPPTIEFDAKQDTAYSDSDTAVRSMGVYLRCNTNWRSDEISSGRFSGFYPNLYLSIPETFTRTIAWLTERGYMEELTRPYTVDENGERYYD